MHTNITLRFLLFLVINLFFSTGFSQSLISIAKQIDLYIEENKNTANTLLATVVNIDSQTNHIKGVREVGNKFANELQKLGFQTYWEAMPQAMHRAGHLFAIRKSTKGQGKRLLLIGHLDTVFPASSQNEFQYLPHHFAKGIGVSDMKGGDVVIIEALKALQSLNLLQDTDIIVALMGDEENVGKPISIARKEFILHAKESDIALDFEAGPPSIGRRGLSTWQIEASGHEQHSSLIFQPLDGYGAIYEIARILNQFADTLNHEENLTVNPSFVYGGPGENANAATQLVAKTGHLHVMAKSAYAAGDLRFLYTQEKLAAMQAMKNIVNHHYAQTQAKITFFDFSSPMMPNSANEKLLQKLQTVNTFFSKTPLTPLPPKLRGGGDICFITNHIKAGLVGLGPNGKYEHSFKEIVDLNSLHMASKRAALLIYMLTHENR